MKKRRVLLIILILAMLIAGTSYYYESVIAFNSSRSTNSTSESTATTTTALSNNYTVRITDSMPLPNVGERFDHMSIDVQDQLVFVAARGNNSVDVANLITEDVSHIITGLNEPQGVYYNSQNGELYVSNGGDGTVDVFGVKDNYHLLKVLNFSGDADNIRYDPSQRLLYVGYGEENQSGIGIINTTSDTIVGSIPLNGHPEAFAIEQNGTSIFVNVPTANAIEVVDKVKHTVVASWPLTNITENFPMALDEKDHRLFVGFALPYVMNVYDTTTGKLLESVNISSDADDLFYDSFSHLILISCSSGFLDVIRQQNADSYLPLLHITTGPLARTSLFYPEQEELFVAVPQHDRLSAQLLTFSIRPAS